MHLSLAPGSEPNPHALAALTKASASCAIIASQDIVDSRGIKLWSRGQAVSSGLYSRLLDRRLQQPLEACLEVRGGVSTTTLRAELQQLLDSADPLVPTLKRSAPVLLRQLDTLPLHPVAHLLLSTAAATRPGTIPHAVSAMALAGTMVASQGGQGLDITHAMLAGLLHDIGELYINPHYLDYTQALDVTGHRHLVVHPRVAQMLLAGLTDYPPVVTRAVAEHHERLDRSGYPARLAAHEVSTLGRVLAVVEVTLGSFCSEPAPLTRASFALRVVSGEFDPQWAGVICDAASSAGEEPELREDAQPSTLAAQLDEIDRHLADAHRLEEELAEQRRSDTITGVVNDALTRLVQLRMAWNALGLWTASSQGASPGERLELHLAEVELHQRIRAFHRECLLLAEGLTEAEKFRLSPLWHGLQAPMRAPAGAPRQPHTH